jgi:hypothetical protein
VVPAGVGLGVFLQAGLCECQLSSTGGLRGLTASCKDGLQRLTPVVPDGVDLLAGQGLGFWVRLWMWVLLGLAIAVTRCDVTHAPHTAQQLCMHTKEYPR